MLADMIRKQPWKGLYLLYQAGTTLFIRIPWWFLYSIPQSNRARPRWTILRVILVNLLKHYNSVLFKYVTYCASVSFVDLRCRLRAGSVRIAWNPMPNYLAIQEGPGVQGVWVSPTPQYVVGDVKKWAENASVECTRIPGYWFDKIGTKCTIGESPRPGEKVLYALHGGGYTSLSAHPTDITSNIPLGVLKHATTVLRSFTLEYRLSTETANPFPAALLDAIAGYSYLVHDVGFSPSDIIIEGDSAGGNLALALTRYLVENQNTELPSGDKLPPPPGRLVLCSPWCDIGDSDVIDGSSIFSNVKADFIDLSIPVSQIKLNFLGPLGFDAANSNRYISPASQSSSMENVSFEGFPPTFIISGGAEVLVDQIRTLRKRLVEDLGDGNVEYVEAPDAIHDFLVLRWHEPERTATLGQMARWVETSSSGNALQAQD